MRRTHYKAPLPALSPCPKCGEMRIPHRVCPNCGYYKGERRIDIED
jgi:large subunit ribosomal protein L32